MLNDRFKYCGVLGGLLLVFSGCINLPPDQRQASIDAAYQRGEITYVQREQMTNDLVRQRQQERLVRQQELQGYQAAMQQNQGTTQTLMSPQQPTYQLYDQYGNPVGTARPR